MLTCSPYSVAANAGMFPILCGRKCWYFPIPCGRKCWHVPLILWPQMRACFPYSVAANTGMFPLLCGRKCWHIPLTLWPEMLACSPYSVAANAGLSLTLWPQMQVLPLTPVAINADMFPLPCGRKCWHWHWLGSSKVLCFFLHSLPCFLLGRRGGLMVWPLRRFNCTGGGDATSDDG